MSYVCDPSSLAAALLEVAVQAVVAQVRLAVPHPLHVDLALKSKSWVSSLSGLIQLQNISVLSLPC